MGKEIYTQERKDIWRMDNDNSEDTTGKEDHIRMDLLAMRVEMYRIMAFTFYNKLDNEDKIDALTEAAEKIRVEVLDEEGE